MLRSFIILLLLLISSQSFAQFVNRSQPLSDTCSSIADKVKANSIREEFDDWPIYVVNDIITSRKKTTVKKIDSISVLKCPDAFNLYGYPAINGAVILKNSQSFKTTTPSAIRERKSMKGPVIYALNGCYLSDSTILISKRSIRKIEVLTIIDKDRSDFGSTVINIRLVGHKQKRVPSLCQGYITITYSTL